MTIGVGATGQPLPPLDAVAQNAKRAEEQGFDVVWWPDHLMGWHPEAMWTPDVTPLAAYQPNPHVYLDPVVAIAASAGPTERIGLGTSVTEPVRNHPAQLARTWLSLDHLTSGRAICGIGAGEGENVTPYGIAFDRPAARLEEALRIMRLLWEHDEPVDYDGEFWTLRDAVIGMGPSQPGRYPPVWVAAHGPRMCRIAGELADGWLPTYMDVEDWSDRWSRIEAAARAVGRDPSSITPGMWAYTVVAEDHETAHRILDHAVVRGFQLALPDWFFAKRGASHPLGEDTYGLLEYVPTRLDRDTFFRAIGDMPFEVVHDATLHGTPDEIAEKVRPYARAGLRHVALWNVSFFTDLERIRTSYRQLAETCAEIKRI